jgi:hypothetical protein
MLAGVDGWGVSALAGTIAAPFAARRGGFDAMRWLRSGLSLALALGILAIALPAAFGAGARDTGVDPVQVLSSGPAVAVDASGGARLSVGGLVPGASRSATIRLSNAGSGTAAFALATRLSDQVRPGGAPLSSVLRLRIASAAGAVLYDGNLAALPQLALGRIEAGGTRAFRFTVTLPDSVGNAVEGSSLSAGFSWIAS